MDNYMDMVIKFYFIIKADKLFLREIFMKGIGWMVKNKVMDTKFIKVNNMKDNVI